MHTGFRVNILLMRYPDAVHVVGRRGSNANVSVRLLPVIFRLGDLFAIVITSSSVHLEHRRSNDWARPLYWNMFIFTLLRPVISYGH